MNDESRHEPSQRDPSAQLAEPTGRARSTRSARLLIRLAKQARRRKFPAEEKNRILLEGIRGEVSVSELCRREGRSADADHRFAHWEADSTRRSLGQGVNLGREAGAAPERVIKKLQRLLKKSGEQKRFLPR